MVRLYTYPITTTNENPQRMATSQNLLGESVIKKSCVLRPEEVK
jgi:hypothetical protein